MAAQDPSGLAGLARLEHGFVPARVTALAALAGGRLATASNDPWTVAPGEKRIRGFGGLT